MTGFNGQVVVVTGGGGGIGGATCKRFAKEGAKVAVFDMNLAAAQKVADEIKAAGGTAAAFACNITDRAQVDAAVAAAEAQLGPIAVLVNNAGWDIFKPFTKTVPAEWDQLIAINLTGALHMHHAVLPGMVARGTGMVINVSSVASWITGGTYSAAKSWVTVFSEAVDRQLVIPDGPSLAVVRLLGMAPLTIPTVMDYAVMAENGSMLNTPPTYGIYIAGLVFKWLKRQGGLAGSGAGRGGGALHAPLTPPSPPHAWGRGGRSLTSAPGP